MRRGRLAILVLVLVGLVFSGGVLLYYARDGGISPPNLRTAIGAFLSVYLPMIGAMAGFLFARGPTQKETTASGSALLLATTVVTAQALGPGVLLLVFGDINSVLSTLSTLGLGSQTVGLAAVTYFYSKT